MRETRTDSIFEGRRPKVQPTEAGISIANIFGNQRLNKAERQGLAISNRQKAEDESSIGDPLGLVEDLKDLAQSAGIQPREIGEEI